MRQHTRKCYNGTVGTKYSTESGRLHSERKQRGNETRQSKKLNTVSDEEPHESRYLQFQINKQTIRKKEKEKSHCEK